MIEPVDLTQDRRVHRQRLRESKHVTKVLPDTDGELSRALSDLEEGRLLIAGEELDEVGEGPSSMQPLADAVGRLASYVAAWERQKPKVQPVAPGGTFELVPPALHAAYVRVTERILATWHGDSPLARYMLYRG